MSAPPEEIVVSDTSSPPRTSSAPLELAHRAPIHSSPALVRASTPPVWAKRPGPAVDGGDAEDGGDEIGAGEDEAMPDAPRQSIITHLSDEERGEVRGLSDGASDSHAGSESGSAEESGTETSGEEGDGDDTGDEQDEPVGDAPEHALEAADDEEGEDEEDEDDEDDNEDDEDEDENEGEGDGERELESESRGEQQGQEGHGNRDSEANALLGHGNTSGDVDMAGVSTEGADAKMKGSQKTRYASPASVDEDDIVMPTSAPTRPTVRLPLAFDLDPQHDTQDAYTMDFPKLLIAHLKPQGDKWAAWFENQRAGKEPEGVPVPPAPTQAPQGAGTLSPELQQLLSRYPVEDPRIEKKKRKKRTDDPYDVGAYDTKDPFVDDSELVVDEPVYFARSARGFFVAAGAANLAKPGKRKKRVSEPFKPKAEERKSGRLSKIMATAVQIEGDDTGGTAMAQLFWRTRVLHDGPIKVDLPNLPADAATQASLASEAVDLSRTLAEATLASPQEGESEAQARLALSGAKRGLAGPACLIPLAHRIDDRVMVPETPAETAGAKRRAYDPRPLPGQLVVGLAALYALRNQESFAVKSKFPPGLKQPLMQLARLALDLGVYNNNFFDWLPSVLPYNRFTLRKLTIREFFADNLALLERLQEESLKRLRELTSKHLGRQREEWERAAAAQNADADVDAGATRVTPQKKWRFTEDEKEEIWLSVVLGDAMTELKNDKLTLEKLEGISDIMSRKTVYRKIAERWPEDGWVTSTLMATQFNSVKKKLERLVRLAEE